MPTISLNSLPRRANHLVSTHRIILLSLLFIGLVSSVIAYSRFAVSTLLSQPQQNHITYNVTAYQWGFSFNGSSSPLNITVGSNVTFIIKAIFNENSALGVNYTQHGFFISGYMSAPHVISKGQTAVVSVLFNTTGTIFVVCTIFCGDLPGVGGHSTMRQGLNVLAPAATPTSSFPFILELFLSVLIATALFSIRNRSDR